MTAAHRRGDHQPRERGSGVEDDENGVPYPSRMLSRRSSVPVSSVCVAGWVLFQLLGGACSVFGADVASWRQTVVTHTHTHTTATVGHLPSDRLPPWSVAVRVACVASCRRSEEDHSTSANRDARGGQDTRAVCTREGEAHLGVIGPAAVSVAVSPPSHRVRAPSKRRFLAPRAARFSFSLLGHLRGSPDPQEASRARQSGNECGTECALGCVKALWHCACSLSRTDR